MSLRAIAVLSLFLLAGCGKHGTSWVKSVSLTNYVQNADVYDRLTVDLNTRTLNFPAFSYPIYEAHSTISIGSIALINVSPGVSAVQIDLDLTQAVRAPSLSGNSLPNGTAIPISVPPDVPVVAFPIGDKESEIYFAFGTGVAMIGAALVVPQFEGIGQQLGQLNVFPRFTIGSIEGVAGVFTGPTASSNGLALFADVGRVPGSRVHVESILPNAEKQTELKKDLNNLSNEPLTIQ